MEYIKKVDDALIKKLEEFHGALVPGLIIGAYMVELAYERLDAAEFVDAVVESRKCIADSVQLMTKCTVGNGWLKVYDWGIFAITLYDKRRKDGIRVCLDESKIPKDTITYEWFFRKVGKHSHPEVNKELLELKKTILSYEPVTVNIVRQKSPPIQCCEVCGTPFPSDGKNICPACRADKYYTIKLL